MGLSLDVDLPLRPITLRHPRKQAIFRVQGAIADGFAQYMQSQGFTHIHTPKIVVAGAEGGANLFKITLALRLIWHSPRSSTSSTSPVHSAVYTRSARFTVQSVTIPPVI